MKNKKLIQNIVLIVLIILSVIMIIFFATKLSSIQKTQVYSDVISYFKNNDVKEYSLNAGTGEIKLELLSDDKDIKCIVPITWFHDDTKEYIKAYNELHPDNIMVQDIKIPKDDSVWINLLCYVLGSAILIGLLYFMFKRASGNMMDPGKQMGFGRSKFKNVNDIQKKSTFKDVAGADEEKEELKEIVDFLKTPQKFNDLGARIPKGVLLVGPPGTGKTLLARAVAGEANVPFFSISGSDFVEMYVGVGASRVRDLFDHAKKNAPCIIFIDELDAVGRQRGAGLGGGHDEREQTLNQLLVEMDGFGANEGVIMIAATNRPDVLDSALMRPGRFDRQIVVSYPDVKGREEILKVHSINKPLAPDVDLSIIAKSTAGLTGADLENLLNEAALLTARNGLKAITMEQIEESTIKVVAGTEKKSKVMSEKEKRITAYHEGGHAIVTYYCETQDPVHQVSIVPRGLAGGYTLSLPSEDKSYKLRGEMMEELMVLLAGRVAEDLVIGDISTGASNDIKRATNISQAMVKKYGMNDKIGPVMYASDNDEVFIGRDMGHMKTYSERVASEIDDEVRMLLTEAKAKAESILNEHLDKLHELVKFLLKHEKISETEFVQIMQS